MSTHLASTHGFSCCRALVMMHDTVQLVLFLCKLYIVLTPALYLISIDQNVGLTSFIIYNDILSQLYRKRVANNYILKLFY